MFCGYCAHIQCTRCICKSAFTPRSDGVQTHYTVCYPFLGVSPLSSGRFAFWVDDETGVSSREELDRVADMFRRKYGISGEGDLWWTLGMKVERDFNAHIVLVSQRSYIEDLLVRFRLQKAQTITTPLAPGTILTKDQRPTTPDEISDMAGNRYRELIGSLQYLSLATRPDITYAINKLSQFLVNPGRAHLNAALRVLRYLKGTRNHSLHLGGGIPWIAGF